MSIYIGNDLEDRFEILEMENTSLRKYNDCHQVVHEIDHNCQTYISTVAFISNQLNLITMLKLRNGSILQ